MDDVRAGLGHWRSSLLASVPAALAVGVLCWALPTPLLLTLIGFCLFVGLLVMARYYVHGGPMLVAETRAERLVSDGPPLEDGSDRDDFAPARYLFYAGMLVIAQTTVRPVLDFTLSDWLFFAALCAALARATMRRGVLKYRIPALISIGAILYVASGLVSASNAALPLYTASQITRFAYVSLVWFWLATTVLSQVRYVRTAAGLWVISVAANGVAAILQAEGFAIPFSGPFVGGRLAGLAEHVNALGGSAAVAMAPALALVFTSSRRSRKALWAVCFLVAAAAVVLSGSITGMVAAVVGVLAWILVSSRGIRTIFIVLAAVVLALGIVQIQAGLGLATPVQRVLSVTGQSNEGRYSTVATRISGYEAAWDALGDGGWLGHGAEPGIDPTNGPRSAHNLVVRAWYEGGWAAALGVLFVLGGALGSALLAARLATTDIQRLLATGFLGAVVAFLVYAFNNPVLSQRFGWVSVALALSCLSVVRAEVRQAHARGPLADPRERS